MERVIFFVAVDSRQQNMKWKMRRARISGRIVCHFILRFHHEMLIGIVWRCPRKPSYDEKQCKIFIWSKEERQVRQHISQVPQTRTPRNRDMRLYLEETTQAKLNETGAAKNSTGQDKDDATSELCKDGKYGTWEIGQSGRVTNVIVTSVTKAVRPSTPPPLDHRLTQKLGAEITPLLTPDSRDRALAGRKRTSRLESVQTPDISPCPKRYKGNTVELVSKSDHSINTLGVPLSEGMEAGLLTNEESPLVIRMGSKDYPVLGVRQEQMEIYIYVARQIHDAVAPGTSRC
jgi:hypothetical protein